MVKKVKQNKKNQKKQTWTRIVVLNLASLPILEVNWKGLRGKAT